MTRGDSGISESLHPPCVESDRLSEIRTFWIPADIFCTSVTPQYIL